MCAITATATQSTRHATPRHEKRRGTRNRETMVHRFKLRRWWLMVPKSASRIRLKPSGTTIPSSRPRRVAILEGPGEPALLLQHHGNVLKHVTSIYTHDCAQEIIFSQIRRIRCAGASGSSELHIAREKAMAWHHEMYPARTHALQISRGARRILALRADTLRGRLRTAGAAALLEHLVAHGGA